MKLSAYNLAIGVQQRLYSYDACIKSALAIADEFCIAYDERFDDPEIFTRIDSRVRPIGVRLNFDEWDWVNIALTAARRACSGDWCLYLEMDEVLHEKDTSRFVRSILDASERGLEALNVRYLNMCQNYVRPDIWGSGRQKFTVNIPEIYHKTADYMIGTTDSPHWDGKYILLGYDDVAYFDERTGRWFCEKSPCDVDDYFAKVQGSLADAIEYHSRKFAYVWHYAIYNYSRKREQSRQTAVWQDRTYARVSTMDIEQLESNLKEPIVLNKEDALSFLNTVKADGWVKASLEHPAYVQGWLDQMKVQE